MSLHLADVIHLLWFLFTPPPPHTHTLKKKPCDAGKNTVEYVYRMIDIIQTIKWVSEWWCKTLENTSSWHKGSHSQQLYRLVNMHHSAMISHSDTVVNAIITRLTPAQASDAIRRLHAGTAQQAGARHFWCFLTDDLCLQAPYTTQNVNHRPRSGCQGDHRYSRWIHLGNQIETATTASQTPRLHRKFVIGWGKEGWKCFI